jgi:tripartite-type tricarboxylate transporter receptor subunit TctC
MSRKTFRFFLAALALAVLLPPAWSQGYPTRPVKIVVPFAVGGPADIYARFIAQRLQDALGQPFVVEDKPGAGSLIGSDAVAKSAADGYTLLLMSNTHTVNETLIANKPFSLTHDFTGIAPINYSDLVLVAHPSLPASNLKDMLKLARERPGKLNYASSGAGTPAQEPGRRLLGAHSVSRQLERPHRCHRWAGGSDVRCRDHHGRTSQER